MVAHFLFERQIITALQILNQYVNPIGLERIGWKFYFVYIVILVIEVLCIWFVFVETKGLTLEEVGHLLDGPDGLHIDEITSRAEDELKEAVVTEHVDNVGSFGRY